MGGVCDVETSNLITYKKKKKIFESTIQVRVHEIYFSLLKEKTKQTHQHYQNKTNNKKLNFCPNHFWVL